MLDVKEYRSISIEFRRIASNLLKIRNTDGNIPVIRFKDYIDNNKIIHKIIADKIDNTQYDFHEYVTKGFSGWNKIDAPVEENKHIKAMYDYLSYIVDNKISLDRIAFTFQCSSNKINDILQNFVELAFKPLIDFISDELSKTIIMMGEDKMNIDMSNNQGSINLANHGSSINSNTTINKTDFDKMIEIIDIIISDIKKLEFDSEEKENITDDMEVIKEQLQCSVEKPTRFKKAFNNAKAFLTNSVLLTSAGVTLANNINDLVTMLQPYIDKIHL